MKIYCEAAKTAVVIATVEQANGSYRIAHKLLFGMYQELKNEGIKVPFEVQNNLMLLHSYLITKVNLLQCVFFYKTLYTIIHHSFSQFFQQVKNYTIHFEILEN